MKKIPNSVIQYAAQECFWQRSGELSVTDMITAWSYAYRCRSKPITAKNIIKLGKLVEPIKNAKGFRKCGVRVGQDVKIDWHLVSDAIEQLVTEQPEIGKASEEQARDWFYKYENIHPFVDGNGRTGSLLHLWLLGKLDDPIHSPNCWNEARRDYATYPQVDLESSRYPLDNNLSYEAYLRYADESYARYKGNL